MNVLSFYKSAIANACMRANAHGEVSFVTKGHEMPFEIDGLRVVLPTPEQLSDRTGKLFFDPLKENVISAESVIVSRYRKAANIKFQYSVTALIGEILHFGTSPADHAKATIEQGEILVAARDADETTIAKWKQLSGVIEKAIKTDDVKHRWVHSFLKRKGTIGDKHFSRVCTITFPFYEQLLLDEKQVFGVPLRRKDREVFRDIMLYIFPGLLNGTPYSYGTNSDIGPFFDAMLGAVNNVGSAINHVVKVMGEFIPHPEEITFDLDFEQARHDGYLMIKDEVLRSTAPVQEAKPLTVAQAQVQQAQYQAQVQPQPIQQSMMMTTSQAPVPVSSAPSQPDTSSRETVRTKSFADVMTAAFGSQPQAMAPAMPVAPPGYTLVQTPMGMVMQPIAQPQPQMMPQGYPQPPMMPQGYGQPQGYPQPQQAIPPGYALVQTQMGPVLQPIPQQPMMQPSQVPVSGRYQATGPQFPMSPQGVAVGVYPGAQQQAMPQQAMQSGIPPGYCLVQTQMGPVLQPIAQQQQNWNGALPPPQQQPMYMSNRSPY